MKSDPGAWSERHGTTGPGRHGRPLMVMAAVLTVTMFGWQGYHIYDHYEGATHEQTTTLVGTVLLAGEHQGGLVEDLEHEVLVFGHPVPRPGVAEWADYYAAASAETRVASSEALAVTGESLSGPVGLVDSTRLELDLQVEKVLDQLSTGQREQTSAALLNPEYLAAQVEFGQAVDGLVAGLAAHLEAKTAAERLNELQSVGIALALFTAAIGAWAVFGRRLRRGQVRLAEEQEQRLEAEAELLQAQKMEALGMMADGVAHDVKNLTNIISGSATDVRQGLPHGHPVSAAVTRIEEATRQADDMARALLAFSRKADLPKGPVDLSALIVGMTPLLKYMVPAPIELVVDVPGSAWIHAYAVQLEQALLNLVANALEAIQGSGTLTIAIRSELSGDDEEPVWRLVVQDTGEGMTPDVKRRVFEPFFTTRPAGQGTGLGLSIVRGIVESHRARIAVTSTPGEGSTFSIELPAIPAPPPIMGRVDRGGLTVLVAGSDPYVRDLIAAALIAEGHHAMSAATVGEVRARTTQNGSTIDLAVIDSRLFVSDRLSVPAGIPVILTGGTVPAIDLAGDQGVHVMGEPLSLAALLETVVRVSRPYDRLAAR